MTEEIEILLHGALIPFRLILSLRRREASPPRVFPQFLPGDKAFMTFALSLGRGNHYINPAGFRAGYGDK
ncbi:hypothetical protein ACVITL_002968 [Rhizobium pisi]